VTRPPTPSWTARRPCWGWIVWSEAFLAHTRGLDPNHHALACLLGLRVPEGCAGSPDERDQRAVSPRSLRHSLITAVLDAGVPLRDVQLTTRHPTRAPPW
jgi:hypothetical protein